MLYLETYDLIILSAFLLLVAGVLSLVVWNRWNLRRCITLAIVAVFLFVAYRALLNYTLHFIMLPTLSWWNFRRDYGIWFVDPFPIVPTVIGTLGLLAQYVLVANRIVAMKGEQRLRLRTQVAVQGVSFLLGGMIATVVYPVIVAATLIPIEEAKTTGDGILIYSQGLHTAVLTCAVALAAAATIVYSKIGNYSSVESRQLGGQTPNSPS